MNRYLFFIILSLGFALNAVANFNTSSRDRAITFYVNGNMPFDIKVSSAIITV